MRPNRYLLLLALFTFFATSALLNGHQSKTELSIASLKSNKEQLKEIVIEMLSDQDYDVLHDNFEIQYKPNLIILVVDTKRGKKFLKLHNHPFGLHEYQGALLLDSLGIPVIMPECVIYKDELELLVQPYVEGIERKRGMLWDQIWEMEEKNEENFWKILDEIYNRILLLITDTLEYSIRPACNDRLYSERLKTKSNDGISGRIESFYACSTMNLSGVSIPWEALLDKQWVIDGVAYKESLRQLIANAKDLLNPSQKRWVAICHGDWHDMNICTSHCLIERNFALLDCELSGWNAIIGDAMVYLIYNSVQGDYLTPKYFPEQFVNWKASLEKARRCFFAKERKITVSMNGTHISLQGVGTFGTSRVRKKIADRFITNYFLPLLEACQVMEEENLATKEQMVKATLLMRLLAVYNISAMEPNDQAKILGLLFKSIATPKEKYPFQPVLKNFLQAL